MTMGSTRMQWQIFFIVVMCILSLSAHAAIGGYSTPGGSHGEGLPTVDPKAHLEIRNTYLWADSKFEGKVRTEHGLVKEAVIPELNAQLQLKDNWWLDTRVFTPFGAGTHYDEYWEGSFHLVDSGLETINIAPGVLWTNGEVAVRVAPQIQIMRRVEFSQALFVPGIIGEIDGDDAWGLGGHVAVAYRPWEDTEFSLGYWSRIEHKLNDGNLRTSFWGLFNVGLGGTKIELATPDVVAVKVKHEFSPAWSAWGLVEQIFWSDVLKELRVRYDFPILPDCCVEYDSRDTNFFGIGVDWRPENSPWNVLTSAGWGSCFVSDENRHPSLVGESHWQAGAEVQYEWSDGITSFVGFKWLEYKDAKSELGGADFPYGFPCGTFFGSLRGEYDVTIWRAEAGVDIRF